MNAADRSQQSCPSVEELSAFHDGCGDPSLKTHVETCGACRQVLAAFGRIDAAVRTAAQPSADLAGRIKTRCRALPKREMSLWTLWNQPSLRWAAAAGVVAAALLLVHQRMAPTGVETTVATAVPPAPPITAPDSVNSGTPPPVPAVPPTTAETGTDAAASASMGQAATGPDPVRGSQIVRAAADPAASGASDMRQALLVPSRVRHVWVVKDVEAAKKTVLASLPGDTSLTVTTAEDGTVSIQTLLSDRALQGLVDTLAGGGLSLVSPTAPQPNRAKNLVVTGRMIRYDMDLVRGP